MKVQKVEKLLEFINRIYTEEKKTKIFLYSEFVDSTLWKDIDLWMELYNTLCKKKLKDIKKTKGNNFLNLFNNVQKLLGANKDEDKIEIVS